jgi:asparagine synthase (glutamine-hydrolysing)
VHEREEVDEEFVADFLLAGDPGPERTIWADARAVPPGSVLAVRGSKAVTNRFWTPHAFEPSEWAGEEEQADVFRALFSEAVRSRLDPDSPNWAELSGGLDSSSVVSMAQTLVENGAVREGVAGTVTLADELGAGDERRFSNLVVQRYGLRNEVIWNPWPWQDGGCPPPRLDEPRAHYPYFLRDELECALLHREGARVLLSGNGSDHYLYGNRYFVSDLAARGQLRCAMGELVRWSIADRQSVWKGLWRHLVLPLAPVALNRAWAPPYDSVPPWIDRRFRQRTAIGGRLALSRTLSARRGTRFAREVANELQELTRWLQRGPFENGIELRYPFLYRPLVELGLSLPVSMRAQPRAPKWLLRQAMRGILPDVIRTRSGKGGIDARILWAMSRERARLTDIVRRSHLAELGLVSREHLWKAVEQAWLGQAPSLVMLLAVLGLETWFYVRSGRWTVDERSVA